MRDSINNTMIGGVKLPKLKGHTKITLTDVRTGRQDIIEKDNMVTQAIRRLFANNYANSLDLSNSQLMPIRNLFGGVLLFNSSLDEQVGNIFPPNQANNNLIAHAGSDADLTHTNPKLGARSAESTEITNGFKWVWDWGTDRGNGTISSLALCSGTGGNVGLTPTDTNFTPMIVADVYSAKFADSIPQYWDTDYTNVKYYPIRYNPTTHSFFSCYLDTSRGFHEIELKHDVSEFGLNLGINDWIVVNERTVTLETLVGVTSIGFNHMIVSDGSQYYVATRKDSSTLALWTINPSGEELIQSGQLITFDITIGEVPFEPTNTTFVRRCPGRYGGIPIHNGYLYIPNGAYTSFIRVNLNNLADKMQLENPNGAEPHTYEPAHWIGDICVGYDYIINSDSVYPLAPTPKPTTISSYSNYFHHCLRVADAPTLLDSIKRESLGTAPGYQLSTIDGLYMATIQNLAQPITKSSAQTMKVEYSLTEVTGS